MLASFTPMRVSTTVQRRPSVSMLVFAPRPMPSTPPLAVSSSASGPISGSRHGVAALPSPSTTESFSLLSVSARRSAESTWRVAASLPISARQ